MTRAPSQRSCVGCRGRAEPAALVRLRRRPDGEVVIDLERRRHGRSAWLHPSRSCILAARRQRAIARALGGPAKLSVREPEAEALVGAIAAAAAARLALLGRTAPASSPEISALVRLQQSLQRSGEGA
ncbi:MAG: YlxR family protein [Nannocystaceae bacterium]